MLSNPAVKIILSKSKKFINDYFLKDTKSPIGSFDVDLDTVIFNTKANNNFLELVHEMGYGNSRGIINLTFIDPMGLFEEELISDIRETPENINLDPEYHDNEKYNPQEGLVVSPGLIQDLNRLLKDAARKNSVYYIAYGISEDIGSWAGPFHTVITGISMGYTGDGLRTFTLELTPSNNMYFNLVGDSPVMVDLKGYERLDVEGRSSPFEYNDSEVDKFDYHKTVVEVIRSYLTKACANNQILFAFPDMNKVVGNAISVARAEFYDKVRADFDSKRFAVSLSNQLESSHFGFQEPQSFDYTHGIKSILSLFGISIKKTPSFQVTGPDPRAAKEMSLKTFSRKYYASYRYTTNMEDARLDGIINSVNNGLYKLDQTRYRLITVEENHTKILDLWKKYGLIEDSSKPVIVCGDLNFIQNYLYGGLVVTSRLSGKSLSEIQSFISNPVTGKSFSEAKNTFKNVERILNAQYVKDISELFAFPKVASVYGSDSLLFSTPDEFSIEQEEFNKLVKSGIPIFRANTKNPNVLTLNVNVNKLYFPFANVTMHRDLPFENMLQVLSTSRDKKDVEEIYGYTEEVEAIASKWLSKDSFTYSKIEEETRKFLIKEKGLKPAKAKDIAQTILYLYFLKQNKNLPKIGLSRYRSKISAQLEIFDRIRSQAFTVDINTLPMFHLSQTFNILASPCFLFARQPVLMGKPIGFREEKVSSLFTGYYSIMAFKHVINTKEAFSSFQLLHSLQHGIVSRKNLLEEVE